MTTDIKSLCIETHLSLREVMQIIDRGSLGIALVVDDCQRFQRTLTDGDIRRAILSGFDLESPVSDLPPQSTPSVVALADTSQDKQRELMTRQMVRHLPLLNEDGTLQGLALASELGGQTTPIQAVIMAGGFGTRLRPLTDDTPKPMLPIGGKPLMERTIENFQKAGINRINVTTHYLPEKITQHFGNGRRFGVELNYVAEDQPLGTAGALRLMEEVQDPLLVINGDILTEVDFRALTEFHKEQNAAMTVALRQYEFEVPYGVVETSGGIVQGVKEKPSYQFLVNAGIYLLEPHVRNYIPVSGRYDMTDLIDAMIENKEIVAGFPVTEYWLDIGHHDDFEQAQIDIRKYRRVA